MKRFWNSLYGKISLIFLSLLLVLGIGQIIIGLYYSSRFLEESDQKLNHDLAANLAKHFSPFLKDSINYGAIEHSFHEMMVMNPRVEFYLLDADGKILAYFADPSKIKREAVALGPIQKFISEPNAAFPLYGDDPRDSQRQKPISVAQISIPPDGRGYLYVILGGELYDSARSMVEGSYILRTGGVTVGIILVLTAVVGMSLFFFLTRRLSRVISVVHEFESGNYAQRVAGEAGDEIGTLGRAIDQMADTIQTNLEEIRRNDQLRRDLIANVSHDLRSPLASIHGYLETVLIKFENLDDAQKQDYLQTVFKNVKRLERLVNDLFELSKLDAQQVQPELESFSLAELTQDVVLKYQPQAEKQRVALRAVFPEQLPFVQADIGMIDRALSNLIENAINYTPQNGEVVIELQPERAGVLIKVSDNGQGIPAADLPYIFDRFYRVEKSRASEGTGLGLAITKKILEAHECDISVTSESNKGTTFEFALAEKPAG